MKNDLAAAIAIGCVLLFALAVGSPLSIGTSVYAAAAPCGAAHRACRRVCGFLRRSPAHAIKSAKLRLMYGEL
ncbi:hypothetical protein ACUNGR_07250 [Serratia sp. IR-2025]